MRVMKRRFLGLILVAIFVATSCPNVAGAGKTEIVDEELAARAIGFERFAGKKLQELNRNHRFARSRMEITPLENGTFRARFHRIDEESLSVKVRRSQSTKIPFVGVASFKEKVYETSAETPDSFDDVDFSVVEIIPNRHIFSYKEGIWN